MTAIPGNLVLAAAFLVLLVVLIVQGLRGPGNKTPGRLFIIIGFGLLVIGNLIPVVMQFLPPALTDELGILRDLPILQDLVGFVGGGLFLALGLLRHLFVIIFKRHTESLLSSAVSTKLHDTNARLAHTNKDLQALRQLLTGILRSSLSGVIVAKALRDVSGEIVDFECTLMNGAAGEIFGTTSDHLTGQPIAHHLPCVRKNGLLEDAISVAKTGLPFKAERCCEHGGKGHWYQIAAVKLDDGVAVTFSDISDRKRFELQLKTAAQHDALTSLPNRAMLAEHITHAVSRAQRFPNFRYAVLFLDFDRFKIVNDSLGHEAGDELLLGIADRLRMVLESIPAAGPLEHLAARLGGDEFVVLLAGVDTVEQITCIAQRILDVMSEPHEIMEQPVVSTASIGIVLCDQSYSHIDEVLRDADTAMYRAKTAGKARFVWFDDAMRDNVRQQLDLERDLRQAVDAGDIDVIYEPIVCLDTNRVVSLDAHLRWMPPDGERLDESDFLDLADELTLDIPIAEQTLSAVCTDLRRWHDEVDVPADLTVSVRVSRRHLLHPEFIPSIERSLAEHDLAPSSLTLNISESAIGEEIEQGQSTLGALRGLGVSIALDDFGAGRSSLGSLHQLPLDMMKIDPTFVDSLDLEDDAARQKAAVIRALVALCSEDGLHVVAKGIETDEQRAQLRTLGCAHGQGPLMGCGMDADEVLTLLRGNDAISSAA